MKKIFTIVLLIGLATAAKSQLIVPTQEELKRFKESKTIVFLELNQLRTYNEKIKEAVEKHWKITPYEFVTFKDMKLYDSLRTDPKLSFLILDNAFYKKDKELTKYQFLNVTLGGNYANVAEMPTISGLPISYADVDESTYDFKLGLILTFIESHIHNLIAHPEIKKPRKALKFYMANMKTIHDKTLYVTKEELTKSVDTEKKIKQFYPYNVKIVSAEEIEKIIDNKDPNAVILHQVAPGKTHKQIRCWNAILGADNASLYFFNWFVIKNGKRPQGLSEKDFKKLAK